MALFFCGMLASQVYAQDNDSSPFTILYDTRTLSTKPLPGSLIDQKTGWTMISEDVVDHAFQGDAVFMNDRLAVVLRSKGSGAELYSKSPDGFMARASLAPGVGGESMQQGAIKILENNLNTVSLEAAFQSSNNQLRSLRFTLNVGQVYVNTQPGEGVKTLRVTSSSRFAVLPDFFADDIVIDARQIPVKNVELPGENFMMQMLGNGDAILLTICSQRDQDVSVSLSGDGDGRMITDSEFGFGGEGGVWVTVLDEPGIWHQREIAKDDAGKIIPLDDWKIPFPGQWRVDWTLANRLIDSWEMLSQLEDGSYYKDDWFNNPASFGQSDWLRTKTRDRWTTVLGIFPYPCWTDNRNRGYLQPLKGKEVQFAGPAIFYPLNRVKATPLNQFALVDIVRETLGVGPCQYILDVEGQHTSYKGRPTCATRDLLNPIYEQKQQKQKRTVVEKGLDDVFAFISHIRRRIDDYVTFGHETIAYLQEQKKDHPQSIAFFEEMETLIEDIDRSFEQRKDKIHSIAYANDLIKNFRKTMVDYEGEDALAKCKKFTAALVDIGGNQDELVGECRVAVKLLRQHAALAMAVNPDVAPYAKEIRRRTQEMLRNPTSYEAPRH